MKKYLLSLSLLLLIQCTINEPHQHEFIYMVKVELQHDTLIVEGQKFLLNIKLIEEKYVCRECRKIINRKKYALKDTTLIRESDIRE